MATVWALRLGLHIAERTIGGREDVRYARLREQWGQTYPARMFGFLMIQAAAAWVLGLAMLVAARNPSPGLGWGDAIGVLLLAVAVIGEGVADWQMRRFRRDPRNKGRVLQDGLWAWSRHPNYFFQFLGWLAYPIIALVPPDSPFVGVVATAAPALMYWLLAYVSGVPPLEREMLASRGAAWRAYQARTSAFFPLPPRDNDPP
jgi:steroid 5-alpha reductase family enzyme